MTRPLRILHLEDHPADAAILDCFIAPGIAFLHKPFTAQALGLKIREVLDQGRVDEHPLGHLEFETTGILKNR